MNSRSLFSKSDHFTGLRACGVSSSRFDSKSSLGLMGALQPMALADPLFLKVLTRAEGVE